MLALYIILGILFEGFSFVGLGAGLFEIGYPEFHLVCWKSIFPNV